MANPVIRQAILARINTALAEAAAIQGLEHNALKGRLREIVIGTLLEPVLGTSFGVGSGAIVDSEGNQSGEVDVIIYNRDIVPPILYGERDGLFPVEACLYAIEVKSVLEVGHLQETINKFRAITELARLPGAQIHEPIGTLLSFGDRIAADQDAILARYNRLDDRVPPLIRVGCVAGRSYWYYDGDSNQWQIFDGDGNRSELVTFVGGFANTVTKNASSPVRRGQFQRRDDGGLHIALDPTVNFGSYIIGGHPRRALARDVFWDA